MGRVRRTAMAEPAGISNRIRGRNSFLLQQAVTATSLMGNSRFRMGLRCSRVHEGGAFFGGCANPLPPTGVAVFRVLRFEASLETMFHPRNTIRNREHGAPSSGRVCRWNPAAQDCPSWSLAGSHARFCINLFLSRLQSTAGRLFQTWQIRVNNRFAVPGSPTGRRNCFRMPWIWPARTCRPSTASSTGV